MLLLKRKYGSTAVLTDISSCWKLKPLPVGSCPPNCSGSLEVKAAAATSRMKERSSPLMLMFEGLIVTPLDAEDEAAGAGLPEAEAAAASLPRASSMALRSSADMPGSAGGAAGGGLWAGGVASGVAWAEAERGRENDRQTARPASRREEEDTE